MSAQDDRNLDDEIRFHLEEETRLKIADGVPVDDARASARKAFGNILSVKEATRAVWTWTLVEGVAQDLKFAGRLMRRGRLFAAFSILSLALGIGATGAIFSLYDAIVLRALPVRDPESLIDLSFAVGTDRPNNFMTYPHFARLRDENTTLEGLFAWTTFPRMSLGVRGEADIVSVALASGAYHSVLGLRPSHGRLLLPDDDTPERATAAVISYGYWQRRFGGADVNGLPITLNQVPFTIVGVEPRRFAGLNVGSSHDVVIPLVARDRLAGVARSDVWDNAWATWIEIMGRRRSDKSLAETSIDLNSIFGRVNAAAALAKPGDAFAQRVGREAHLNVAPGAHGGQSGLRTGYARWLWMLLMMLGGVVLLASLNVATLLLARAAARRDEIRTRLAIGAGRWRIVRQLMTEAFLIAACGGAAGLLFASWAGEGLLRIAMPDAPIPPIDIRLDARVIAFTIGVTALTCLCFGVAPALRATASARLSARATASPDRRLLERILVATQTAVSLVLIVFAVLFVRSLQNLWAVDPGYDRTNVVMFSLDAGLTGRRAAERGNIYRTVLDALESVPGVRSATASAVGPISRNAYFIDSVTRAGANDFRDERRIRVAFNYTAPRYFETLGIPLLAGRDFDRRDSVDAPKVAIVSEALAARFAGNPVGQQITIGRSDVREVVGVARNHRYARLGDVPRDVVYVAMLQEKSVGFAPVFEIRHEGSAADVLRSAREAVARIDRGLTPFRTGTLEAHTRDSLAQERLLAMVSSYVGGFALLLACIGLYGLMTYTVAQRTPEIGLRMALGSSPSGIRRVILTDSALTVLSGALAGVGAAAVLVRVLQARLFGLQPTDPLSTIVATVILVTVALCAACIPAARASRINPVVALRNM